MFQIFCAVHSFFEKNSLLNFCLIIYLFICVVHLVLCFLVQKNPGSPIYLCNVRGYYILKRTRLKFWKNGENLFFNWLNLFLKGVSGIQCWRCWSHIRFWIWTVLLEQFRTSVWSGKWLSGRFFMYVCSLAHLASAWSSV